MRIGPLIVALTLVLVAGCKQSSSFGGSSKQTKAEPKKDQTEDAKPNKAKDPKSKPLGEEQEDEDIAVDPAFDENDDSTAPPTAVTAGSFRAWAEPAQPAEGQDYTIFIEVKLPQGKTNGYAKEDLSGVLTGTDGYQQAIERSFAPIPGPFPIIPPFDPKGTFAVTGNFAKISFMVPGAERTVKDTIQIRSNILNEAQTVTLVFQ